MKGWKSGRTKYGNKPTTYNGTKYHSKLEAGHAAELDLLLKAKKIGAWERQVRVRLYAYGDLICTYIVDFVITHRNGKTEYLESKGAWSPASRIKWKLFTAQMRATQPEAILTVRYK